MQAPAESRESSALAVQQAQASLPTNVELSAMGLDPAGQPPEKAEHTLAYHELDGQSEPRPGMARSTVASP